MIEHVELGHMRPDHGRQLRQDHLAHRDEILLALQHAAEFGEIGLERPARCFSASYRADWIISLIVSLSAATSPCACTVIERVRVALGHCRRHLGDGAHLRRQILRQLIDVLGQALPGAGGARHLRLAAELAFDADLARHRRHLIGEGRQRVGHAVDRFRQRRDRPWRRR